MISYNVVIMLCLVPELQSVILTNVNGNLTVKWTFIYTYIVLLLLQFMSQQTKIIYDNINIQPHLHCA